MTHLDFVSDTVSVNNTCNQPEFTDVTDRSTNNEKKVHWNCKYVEMLLDCVESRMCEFKNKSIHKKVWDEIGREMLVHGFSTEHCYNKWKNLRRDVRMVALHPGKGARNEQTLYRVQQLISSICPSFDPCSNHSKKASRNSPQKQSEASSNSLEPLSKLLTPATSPFSDGGRPNLFLGPADAPHPSCLHAPPQPQAAPPASPASWPYELYDLLLKFRAEEVKQAQSIEMIGRQIDDIRDCSVRRMNTIQQLMNLAHVLIGNKVS